MLKRNYSYEISKLCLIFSFQIAISNYYCDIYLIFDIPEPLVVFIFVLCTFVPYAFFVMVTVKLMLRLQLNYG